MKFKGIQVGNLCYQFRAYGNSERKKRVKQITCNHLNCIASGYDIFYPIPLTEEWLLKLGFEKMKNYGKKMRGVSSYSWFYNKMEFLAIHRSDYDFEWHYIFKYPGLEVEIANVHNLQNLIFGILGEDLVVK